MVIDAKFKFMFLFEIQLLLVDFMTNVGNTIVDDLNGLIR